MRVTKSKSIRLLRCEKWALTASLSCVLSVGCTDTVKRSPLATAGFLDWGDEVVWVVVNGRLPEAADAGEGYMGMPLECQLARVYVMSCQRALNILEQWAMQGDLRYALHQWRADVQDEDGRNFGPRAFLQMAIQAQHDAGGTYLVVRNLGDNVSEVADKLAKAGLKREDIQDLSARMTRQLLKLSQAFAPKGVPEKR